MARADEALRPDQIPERARELADRGRAFHDAGDYPHAIAAFKEAYVLAPSPGLLFNLAQAYRLEGDCDDAAWMYRRYLETNPSPDARILVEAQLSAVAKCGRGGLRIGLQPATLDVKPPVASPAQDLALTSSHDEAPGHRQRQLGVSIAIGGGVALAGAAYFALDAQAASKTVSELYKAGGKWQDIAATDERGHRSATFGTVLGITGLAAAVTGGVIYMMGRHDEQPQHVAVLPLAHGAEVSLTWGF